MLSLLDRIFPIEESAPYDWANEAFGECAYCATTNICPFDDPGDCYITWTELVVDSQFGYGPVDREDC